jgi:SsrA-binding protein
VPGRPGEHVVATNRRARFDYELTETVEAGMVLTGPEVKSLRAGKASLSESFARVRGGEIWLENMHIPPYENAKNQGYDPRRPRKLLLHRREIDRLLGKASEKGLTLVPIKVYFSHGLAKCELGLGRGRKRFEKRQAIAEREHKREMQRAAARERRGPSR